MSSKKFCLTCNLELKGRTDKKFCNPQCKSAYHYEKAREENNFFFEVDHQLKKNRKLLKYFNKAGKATVRAQRLVDQGFNSNFFTHFWKNTKGDVYLFVYEYGFLSRTENGKKKYILITWQPYMKKRNIF